jgi:hypothetical protein
MARLAGPSIAEWSREAVVVLVIAALLGAFLLASWWMAPREAASRRTTATIQALGTIAVPKAEPVQPQAQVALRLADGTNWTLTTLGTRVGRCRVGDSVTLSGAVANSGAVRWELAPGGCVGP